MSEPLKKRARQLAREGQSISSISKELGIS